MHPIEIIHNTPKWYDWTRVDFKKDKDILYKINLSLYQILLVKSGQYTLSVLSLKTYKKILVKIFLSMMIVQFMLQLVVTILLNSMLRLVYGLEH